MIKRNKFIWGTGYPEGTPLYEEFTDVIREGKFDSDFGMMDRFFE
jgi:hypothetical protein